MASMESSIFIRTLRPHFVKGAQSVFMWRFFQQLRAHRQGQDFIRWIGKLQVQKKRTLDAWMDLLEPVLYDDSGFQADWTTYQQAQLAQNQPPMDIEVALERYNRRREENHKAAFPLSDNLYALTFIVLADLSEPQRERLTSTLTLRGYTVQMYTFEVVREVFLELFCMPKSSLENPSL